MNRILNVIQNVVMASKQRKKNVMMEII